MFATPLIKQRQLISSSVLSPSNLYVVKSLKYLKLKSGVLNVVYVALSLTLPFSFPAYASQRENCNRHTLKNEKPSHHFI